MAGAPLSRAKAKPTYLRGGPPGALRGAPRAPGRHDGHAAPGDVALVPADSELRVDAGPDGATACVTTTPGLEAATADGTRIKPPWAA